MQTSTATDTSDGTPAKAMAARAPSKAVLRRAAAIGEISRCACEEAIAAGRWKADGVSGLTWDDNGLPA